MDRRMFVAAIVTAAVAGATMFPSSDAAASTPGWTTYTPAAFTAAQSANKTIVVDIYASWCPTCRAQAPILDRLRSEPRLADAVFMKVDFDEERAFLREHRIPRQSTILVFRGTTETARSIAETNPRRLRAAVLAGV